MISFNGNSILLVESDKAYGIQLKEILQEKGAMVTLAHSFEEAKVCLNRSDVDILISTHRLPDGTLRELFEWCKDSLSTVPVLAALGNCTQLEKKQLEKTGVEHFFSKADSKILFEAISRALFDFDDFKKNYLESKYERGISYDLVVGKERLPVKALEIMDKGVFLSFETPFSFGHEATLELTCSEEINLEDMKFQGVLQGEFSEGQFFKVNDGCLDDWKKLLSELDRKQNEVSEFLRKAAGK